MKSLLLTLIQYLCLVSMLYFFPWFSNNAFLLIIQIIGFGIALWSILEMKHSRLNISPTPLKNAILITSGPYKYIRHPMYLSLILAFTPLLITYFSSYFLIIFIVFIVNLVFKFLYEESLLIDHFSDYKDYMKKSWRILPYVF